MAQLKKSRKNLTKDYLYQNELVSKLINRILKRGNKNLAYKIVYKCFEKLKEKKQQDPIQTFEEAVQNTSPTLEVKAKRIGGAVYQVPIQISKKRAESLSLGWILKEARSKSNESMIVHLTNSILDGSNKVGTAIKKKEELHRSAEANRTYS